MFTERDLENDYDESDATQINLSGDSVTISQEGIYILTGEIDDGQIIIEADDTAKIQLILDGVTINSSSSAAIYVKSANKVFITLAENSTNTLSNSGEFVAIDDNNIDGAIFSTSDITFNGTGTLNISSDYGHGIVGKDDVVITSGTYNIVSESDGIKANDSIRISDGTFNIESGSDGLDVENDEDGTKGYCYISNGTFNISAVKDGIVSSNTMQIDGGDFTITSGGGFVEILNSITVGEGSGNTVMATENLEYSMKGIKSGDLTINDSSFNISSYEDGIHANGDFTINGGSFYVLSGDDGIHADELLTINDGEIEVAEAYEGIEGNNITINGGTISVIVLDDAINSSSSSGTLTITGGDLYIECSGDGLDSNGDFEMTGGAIVFNVNAIYTGGDSEVDVSGSVSYTGGTLVDVDGKEIDPTSSSSSMGGTSFFSPFTSNRR